MSSLDFNNLQCLVQQATTIVDRIEKGLVHDTTAAEQMLAQAESQLSAFIQASRRDSAQAATTLSLRQGGQSSTASSALTVKRAESLLADCASLQASVDRKKKKLHKEQTAKLQREQLLGGLSTSSYFNRANDTDASLLAREEQSLKHSRTRVKQMVEESESVMNALRGQGQRLSSSNSKAAEILESLGVSNQTLLSIVRTNRIDAWIVYIGMGLLLFLMWIIWTK